MLGSQSTRLNELSLVCFLPVVYSVSAVSLGAALRVCMCLSRQKVPTGRFQLQRCPLQSFIVLTVC